MFITQKALSFINLSGNSNSSEVEKSMAIAMRKVGRVIAKEAATLDAKFINVSVIVLLSRSLRNDAITSSVITMVAA